MSEFIYKSTDPAVLTAWHEAETAYQQHSEVWTAQLAEWGFASRDVWTQASAFGGGSVRVEAVEVETRAALPDGWRIERGHPTRAVPARSTAAGKRIAARWDAIRCYPSPRRALHQFGMPTHVFDGLTVATYAARVVDGVLWVRWLADPKIGANDHFQPVKLSEFYAMVEAGSDPFAERETADAS